MKTSRTEGRRGAALVIISVAMVAVGMLGAAMLSMNTAARRQRLYADIGSRAYYAAESGKSYVYSRRAVNPHYVPVGTFVMISGDRFLLSSALAGTNLVVTSTGVAHAGTHRESRHPVTFLIPHNPIIGIEDVFLWAQQVSARGSGTLTGQGGVIVITGDLVAADLRGGTDVEVTTIFIEGSALLNAAGNVSLGSSSVPGNIYIAGDLELLGGTPTLYGDVHVNGNLRISHGTINGDMYVHGNVEFVGSSFSLSAGSRIYYTGSLVNWPVSGPYASLAVALDEASMPPFLETSELTTRLRDPRPGWYTGKGYVSAAPLASNLRVYTAGDYVASSASSLANVVIVSEGDISISLSGNRDFIGVLIAPNGSVTFNGKSFEGLVIAGEGFFTGTGSPDVTFRSIADFFNNPDDYPVVIE